MPIDIRNHPDAPSLESLQNVVVEPVPRDEIAARRDADEYLLEDNLVDREDLDVRLELSDTPGGEVSQDVGTVLYRFTQLFGTPQLPEYQAGEDISFREETVFKYLFRASTEAAGEDLPEEWLVTVFDYRVGLGVGVATWGDDPAASFTAERPVAITSLALAHNIANEAVECVYEDVWY